MEAAFFITLFYIYLPIILGVTANHALNNGFFVDTPCSYILKWFKLSTHDERFLLLFFVASAAIAPALAYLIGVDPDSRWAQILSASLILLWLALSTTYVLTSKVVKEAYTKYSGYLNPLIIVTATINLAMASNYADGIISELTGVRGSELPTGLVWLSIIMAPAAWVITLAFGSLVIYAIAMLRTYKKRPKWTSLSVLDQVPTKKNSTRDFAAGYAVALSFAILATSPLSIVSSILASPWAEKTIREQLVSASFHVKAEKCGIEGMPGAKIAYLEDDKAIIALADEKLGYIFARLECATTWNTPRQILKKFEHASQ